MRKILTVSLMAAFLFTIAGFTTINPLPTSIRLTVIDYVGNIVEGASVKLYLTEEDYRNETNQVGETVFTDKKGRATIKDLEARVYYIYVNKGDMNNIGGGVMTDTLVAGKVNKLNIIIE